MSDLSIGTKILWDYPFKSETIALLHDEKYFNQWNYEDSCFLFIQQ
jgi:hypothetical protein